METLAVLEISIISVFDENSISLVWEDSTSLFQVRLGFHDKNLYDGKSGCELLMLYFVVNGNMDEESAAASLQVKFLISGSVFSNG